MCGHLLCLCAGLRAAASGPPKKLPEPGTDGKDPKNSVHPQKKDMDTKR